jgi:hypothetical protein
MLAKMVVIVACVTFLSLPYGVSCGAESPSAATQRQEHEKAAEKKLKDLNKKMDELAAESRKAAGKTRDEMNRLYEEFKKKQGAASKELEELRKSTNETWDKTKVRMDKSLEDLNGLYDKAKTKVKEKDKDAAK